MIHTFDWVWRTVSGVEIERVRVDRMKFSRAKESLVPILKVRDAAVAVDFYDRLGFVKEWEHRFEPGLPLYVSIARGEARLHLSEHEGDARPGTLVYLYVADVDAAAHAVGVEEIETVPWGREFEVTDPDGNRLRIGTLIS